MHARYNCNKCAGAKSYVHQSSSDTGRRRTGASIKIMGFLSTRFGAFLALAAAFGLVFNPFSKFPFTFLIVIAFVLLVTWLQNGHLRAIGFKKFGIRELGIALLVFVPLELFVDFIVQPEAAILFNEPANYSAFAFLEGDLPQFAKYLSFMWISAAIGEELLFRGFAMLQLEKIVGKVNWLNIVLSSVLFTLPHWYQGPTGIVVTFVFGLAFGAVWVQWRNIWINILLHALIDTLFLTLAYFGMLSYYG